jgi:peptidoglycan/xylan/chitin deacetylase (PgdA/CDA1 family)
MSSLAKAADVAITMDDFDIDDNVGLTAAQREVRILSALKKHHAHAMLFVIGRYIRNAHDKKLLRAWARDGHIIANHTFSHQGYFENQTFEAEIEDILKCDKVLKNEPGFEKFFRYPMLAEGDTVQKRDWLRAWLGLHGYKVGSVTIDTSDWYIDARLRDRLKKNPKADLAALAAPYRDYYLAHMWDRATYYNNLSQRLLGREVKHTILVHFNLLEALYLDDLLTMFESHGWKIIDAKTAYQDPVFQRLPDSMPSGQSILWGIAKETGKYDKELRYPGEGDIYEKPKMDALGL